MENALKNTFLFWNSTILQNSVYIVFRSQMHWTQYELYCVILKTPAMNMYRGKNCSCEGNS